MFESNVLAVSCVNLGDELLARCGSSVSEIALRRQGSFIFKGNVYGVTSQWCNPLNGYTTDHINQMVTPRTFMMFVGHYTAAI